MTASNTKTSNKRAPPVSFTEPVSQLFWTQEQTARRLGISVRTLFELKEKHLLYKPDGMRNVDDHPKKPRWSWSDGLVNLIAHARSLTVQGVRQLTDDEALAVRRAMEESKQRQYLAFLDG